VTDLQASQGFSLVVAGVGGDAKAAQAFAQVVLNYPSDDVRVAQGFALAPYSRSGGDDTVRAAQAFVLAVVRGLPDWPVCRAWTFTLDGHDFYVLNTVLETFVCDLSADPPAWSIWGTGDDPKWRGWVGKQWVASLPYEETFGSNVLVGDTATGTLYFLNPAQATDDSGDFDINDAVPFKRVITGQIALRGRSYVDCLGVEVTGSVGEVPNSSLTAVELFTSDDSGNTYTSHGELTVAQGTYDTRLDWYSLGSMTAPGRLFRVVDYGALIRIDDLEMPDNGVPES
jgi:hypothetical protein